MMRSRLTVPRPRASAGPVATTLKDTLDNPGAAQACFYMFMTVSPDPGALREGVRETAAGVAARHPRTEWLDHARAGRRPDSMWSDMAEAGLLGLGIPEEFGGSGGGVTELAIVMDVLATAGVPTLHLVLTGLAQAALLRSANPEQLERYVRPSISGTHRLCLGVTEPDAGTNTFGIRTTASRRRGGWTLSGQKTFITGADEAAHMFTVARSRELSPTEGRAALSIYMVPLDAPGIELQKLDIEIVQPESQFTVILEGVELDAGTLIGHEGDGAVAMFDALNAERILIAAMALGLGDHAIARAVDYARERAPFGRPIGAYQAVQHRLARAKAHVEAARALTYQAAEAFDRGEDAGTRCTMAKLLASEAGVEAVDAAIQVHGGYAFSTDYDVLTLWPLVRLLCVAPVNNEMALNAIGERTLGLPKSY